MNKENLAIVIGGTGAIGNAVAHEIEKLGFKEVLRIGTKSTPPLNFNDESTIVKAAEFIKKKNKQISILFDATGVLHYENFMPEKTFKNINFKFMEKNFLINAIGPALLIKHFAPLLDNQKKSVFATLSAKVGSINDNNYGGWYSYRASKAALNQLIKTISIEMKIKNKQAIFIALHPGTVNSNLSKPFQKNNLKIQEASESAQNLIKIIKSIDQSASGKFYNWDGSILPW